jgi:hypothetical protein
MTRRSSCKKSTINDEEGSEGSEATGVSCPICKKRFQNVERHLARSNCAQRYRIWVRDQLSDDELRSVAKGGSQKENECTCDCDYENPPESWECEFEHDCGCKCKRCRPPSKRNRQGPIDISSFPRAYIDTEALSEDVQEVLTLARSAIGLHADPQMVQEREAMINRVEVALRALLADL